MDDPNCNYINPNMQNARDMNLNCINNPLKGEDKYCMSEYKLYDNIAQRSVFHPMKRDIDSGYNISNHVIYEKKYNDNSPSYDFSNKEGFTSEMYSGKLFIGSDDSPNKLFIGPDGPGKRTLTPGKCPQGYSFDPKKKSCVQVCMGCKYEDNMKSQEFNEYDPCFPNGVYDGREKDGTIKCNCGIDNKYCSDSFIGNIFSTIGLILR